jgi:thioredoxin-like negative regulator of GroEL
MERVADKYKERIKIGMLEFNCHGQIHKEYSMYELPVFLLFVNGLVVNLITGAVSMEVLEARIDEVLYKNKEV